MPAIAYEVGGVTADRHLPAYDPGPGQPESGRHCRPVAHRELVDAPVASTGTKRTCRSADEVVPSHHSSVSADQQMPIPRSSANSPNVRRSGGKLLDFNGTRMIQAIGDRSAFSVA